MVEKLQKNPELLQLGGETRELSIMFTDVRGFTSISEHYGTDVQGLTKIMNRYMTAMTQSILESNGTLDKYIGDAQMAFWNAPLDDTQHAKHAVEAAVKMLDKLKEFNDEIAKEGVPPFGMGLGINTGNVVVPDTFVLLKLELPLTFNDDINVVILFNVVIPETFNDDINVVLLFNLVVPDIFVLFKFVIPDTFNDDINVTLL